MPRKRRSFSAAFKAKVALDAHKGLKTAGELAKQHQVHPTQIALWKKQLLEGAEGVFEGDSSKAEKSDEPESSELYEQIGKLNMQLEWLKKKVAEHGG
jgi:putative transposase